MQALLSTTMGDTVMEHRLAAATAIPPSQRSPEVAAFIECCQLQREVATELQQWQVRHPSRQQQALADLKLTRSYFLSPTGTLWYRPSVFKSAAYRLVGAAASAPAMHGARSGSIGALVASQFTTETLLLMAAGDPTTIRSVDQEPLETTSYLLPVYNSIVDRMQQPAVAARLRRELQQLQAGIPRPLLSYDELLIHFVMVADLLAGKLLSVSAMEHGSTTKGPHTAPAMKAVASAAELLPRLVPGDLRWEFAATMAGELHISLNSPRTQFRSLAPCITRVSELFERVQQQGRDYIVAICGYHLARISYSYGGFGCADGDGSHPPSAFPGWLQQAEQAYARCRAVLPKQWVAELKGSQESALARKPLLERLQRQGDRWQLRTVSEASQVEAQLFKGTAKLVAPPDLGRQCSNCHVIPPCALLCAGCREVRYCSRECQKAHWSQHKTYCKARQQLRKPEGE